MKLWRRRETRLTFTCQDARSPGGHYFAISISTLLDSTLLLCSHGSMHRYISFSVCRVLPRQSSRLLLRTLAFKHGASFRTSSTSYALTTRRNVTACAVSQHADSTIYALSTAPGRAAIAIIRVSGPACSEIYEALCPETTFPKPRFASVRSLHDPSPTLTSRRSILDSQAVVLSFPAPKTVTGENVLEFHVHGGPAIIKAVLAAIGRCTTTSRPVRYAEPGEFTRRAFLNDRLDLPQIESLGDTLSAVTEEQRRLSVQGTVSGLASRYESWRQLLLYARGELEALIDFSEDQHFDESPAELASNVSVQVKSLLRRIQYHLANAVRGELLRNGISISLVGAPNVGKSSLLNLIVGRNAAIVSEEAGTTRDVVEVGIDLGGFFCRLGDTAGLRREQKDSASKALASVVGGIEREGIRRAKERALQSDIVLLVLSIEPSIDGQGANLLLEPEVLEIASQLGNMQKTVVIVVNKMDNYGDAQEVSVEQVERAVKDAIPTASPQRLFCVSCREVETAAVDSFPHANADPGRLSAFLSGLTATFKDMTTALAPSTDTEEKDPSQWQESLGATQRQGALLEECSRQLQIFLDQVAVNDERKRAFTHSPGQVSEEEIDIVAAAEALRSAAECLGKLTGRGEAGDVEEVLGVVFEKFCVGK